MIESFTATTSEGLRLAGERFPSSGDKPPILLVMGLGAQMLLWPDGLCQALADAGHPVVRYDNRDVGLSSRLDDRGVFAPHRVYLNHRLGRPIPPPYTLTDMAGDAVAMLDHLGWDRAVIVGASMGGMITQRIATRHPDRVQAAVSIMSAPRIFLPRPGIFKLLLKRPEPGRDGAIAHTLHWLGTTGSQTMPVDRVALAEIAGKMFDRGPSPQGYARHLHAIIADGDRRPHLAATQVPFLVVHGAQDPLIPLRYGLETATATRGRMVVLRDMGHDLPVPLWPRLVDEISGHAAPA